MIVVTGAAGFIGSNLAHRLAAAGHHVWLVDHPFTAEKARNWVGLSRFCFTTVEHFLPALRSRELPIEVVFHLGACSRTTEADWDYLLWNNVGVSQALWAWCAEAGKPFYYASSAATYGDGSNGFDDRTAPSRLRPLNLYGRSKNEFDLWVWRQVAEGLPTPPAWAGLKFFNVYGPRESHKGEMASVVWQVRRQVLETGEARLFRSNDPAYPDGGQKRDFVFVEDCVDQMLWLWQHRGAAGVFNVGTGASRTFNDLAKAVCAAVGVEPRVRYVDMPGRLSRQYQNFTEADMSKLHEAGYSKPPTPLEEGVRRAIAAEDARCTP